MNPNRAQALVLAPEQFSVNKEKVVDEETAEEAADDVEEDSEDDDVEDSAEDFTPSETEVPGVIE